MLRVNTGGRRNERNLTDNEINSVIEYAVSLGMPRERIYYVDYDCTAYGEAFDILRIGTDVYPSAMTGGIDMKIIKYYGSDADRKEFINHDSEPIMAVIAHDRSHAVVSLLDEGFEHHILLAKAMDRYDIDKYFRIIFDDEGADWTFVCLPDYKGIKNKERRIERFFADGTDAITELLKALGYDVPINIPKRYRRHMDYLGNSEY